VDLSTDKVSHFAFEATNAGFKGERHQGLFTPRPASALISVSCERRLRKAFQFETGDAVRV
jgi:hypothetical protein